MTEQAKVILKHMGERRGGNTLTLNAMRINKTNRASLKTEVVTLSRNASETHRDDLRRPRANQV